MSLNVNNGAADSENYVQRDTRTTKRIGEATDVRKLMSSSQIADGPAPVEGDRPGSPPVITEQIVQENLRRVQAGAANTLVTVHPDGTRSYRHDIVVRDGDGIRDTLATDRGKGTTESLDLLAKEGKVKVEGLLDRRGADGRFKKGA